MAHWADPLLWGFGLAAFWCVLIATLVGVELLVHFVLKQCKKRSASKDDTTAISSDQSCQMNVRSHAVTEDGRGQSVDPEEKQHHVTFQFMHAFERIQK